MNELYRFARLLLLSLLAAMIFSPWFYLGLQWASLQWGGTLLDILAHHPFTRYFNRVWQAAILAGIGWEVSKRLRHGHSMRLHSWRAIPWDSFGLKGGRPMTRFLSGLGLSLLIFGLYTLLIYASGWNRLRPLGFSILGITGSLEIVWAALGVAILEEGFFRGYFLGICVRALGNPKAIGINVLFFATIHFIHSPHITFPNGVTWHSGFQALFLFLKSFEHPLEIAPGFLVLALAAWILCWSVLKTGGIYLAIGLHAGWILAIKLDFALMLVSSPLPLWLFGGGDLSHGILALLPLGLEFAALKWWLGRSH